MQGNKAHQDISQTLKKMGIEHENEAFVSGFFVDILIKEPKIIIDELKSMIRKKLDHLLKSAEKKGATGAAQKRNISNCDKDMKRRRSGSY